MSGCQCVCWPLCGQLVSAPAADASAFVTRGFRRQSQSQLPQSATASCRQSVAASQLSQLHYQVVSHACCSCVDVCVESAEGEERERWYNSEKTAVANRSITHNAAVPAIPSTDGRVPRHTTRCGRESGHTRTHTRSSCSNHSFAQAEKRCTFLMPPCNRRRLGAPLAQRTWNGVRLSEFADCSYGNIGGMG